MMMLQRLPAILAALGMMALMLLPPSAQAAEFVEGVHYEKLDVPVKNHNPEAVEVVEVFSYACVHCKTFDPTLEVWKQELPDGVEFRRLPAIFDQTWAWFAQAYYAAQVLGVSDQVHTPLFMAIHDQGVDLRDPTLMASLFEQAAGVDPEEFAQVVNSFGVRSQVQQADAHGRALRITGVPTLVVDGRYKVDGRMAGNNANMLAVVDYLVAMRQKESASAQ